MRIGVLLPNWVGDVVLATPLLRALRRRFSRGEIVAIARPMFVPLLAGTDWIDRWQPWERHGRGWLGRTWQLVRNLRREKLDALLVTRNSPSAAVVARLSGARQTIGYARRGAGLLLSTPLPPPRSGGKLTPISAVDYFLALARPLGCHGESQTVELATLPADELLAAEQWQRLGLPDGERVVLLNSGGAYGTSKQWPAEHSARLARRIADELGVTVLVLCGPSEREAAAAIAAAADHPRVLSLAGEDVSFGVTKALARRARLLVTTDSGPRHIAAAMGTPTITLFGPIDPRWSENYQPGAMHLRLPLDCSPCGKRVCPLGHGRCMSELTPDLVLRAVSHALTQPYTAQARQVA
ncbi:MAG: lipopolysaccharide heptosyltransferase II [Pirellulaceae bacterium]|nr:lipopolysaccharide heptosyltransferase II [Pirellulaceae bacterium]